jgi:hypothetical protein
LEKAYLSSFVPRISSKKIAALVNPENKPTQVNWSFSWPSAFEICGKIYSLIRV